MDVLTFISTIINSLAWPIIILVLVILFRKPLLNLVPFLERLKYKDFELQFSRDIQLAKDVANAEIPIENQEREILSIPDDKTQKLIEVSPSSAIVESWKQIEEIAFKKLQQLYKSNPRKLRRLTARTAIHDLMYNGILIPPAERLLENLYSLRNQAVHAPSFTISKENALEYNVLANRVKKQIDAITELPSIRLQSLTLTILQLNHLLDTGKYNDISTEDVKNEIEKGTILRYLKDKAKGDIDLSLFLESDTYPNFEKLYCEQLQSILEAYGGDERRKWGVEKLGLCLLIAWTNEIIQLGSGWYPSE